MSRFNHSHIRNYPHKTAIYSLNTILLLLFFITSISAQQGLIAEYFDGKEFEKKVITKIDQDINLNWNRIPPVQGIDPHVCSIRWTGIITPEKSGTYTFSARVDDGIRVWINDQIVIDDWKLNDVGIFHGSLELIGGKKYGLKVEYFNALIEGEISLLWKHEKENRSWFQRTFNSDPPVLISAKHFSHTPEQAKRLGDLAAPKRNMEAVKVQKSVSPSRPKPIAKKPPAPTEEKEIAENPIHVNPSIKIATPEIIKEYIPRNIHFEQAKADLLPSSFIELDRLAEFLVDHPKLQIQIEGHTDSAGDPEKNLLLSQRRAYAVARYLVTKGIEAKRIKANGFGSEHPLIKSDDRKYHPENRRVEFIIE